MHATQGAVFATQVLMIRPAAFGFNAETAASNGFQRGAAAHADAAALARRESAALADALVRAGVDVWMWDDTPDPPKPDAVFPNNWLSTHPDGRVYLYPMAAPNRRAERSPALIAALVARHRVAEVVDWSGHAAHGRYLEGTGSLVLDVRRGRVFACRSPRTDPGLVVAWAARQGLEPVLFDAHDAAGRPIYHTNVILCVGDGFTACGLAQVPADQRPALRDRLAEAGACIELDPPQIDRFAGNMLQLVDARGGPLLALSRAALDVLRGEQRRALERHTALLPVALPTIEAVGGGSARCMLAELFLP